MQEKERQEAQDRSAGLSSDAAVERVIAKGSRLYRSRSWDLVDAVREEEVKLEELADADLPEEMRSMNLEERKAYIAKKAQEREQIKAQITQLREVRTKEMAVAAAQAKRAEAKAAGRGGAAVASGAERPAGANRAAPEADAALPEEAAERPAVEGGERARDASGSELKKAPAAPARETLDSAVIRMLRKQAAARKFTLEPEKKESTPEKKESPPQKPESPPEKSESPPAKAGPAKTQ